MIGSVQLRREVMPVEQRDQPPRQLLMPPADVDAHVPITAAVDRQHKAAAGDQPQALRIIEVGAGDVQMTVIARLQPFEEVERIVFSGDGAGDG